MERAMVAEVHASPVFRDLDATTDKAPPCRP